MDEHDLNISGLAAKMGLAHPSVWAWVHGKSIPSNANIRKLATALEVPVSEIYVALARIPPRESLADLPEEKRILIEYIIGLPEQTTARISGAIRALTDFLPELQVPPRPPPEDETPEEATSASEDLGD